MSKLLNTVNQLVQHTLKYTSDSLWNLYNQTNKKNKDYKMLAHDLELIAEDMNETNNIGEVYFKNTHRWSTNQVLDELTRWIKGRFYPTCETIILDLIRQTYELKKLKF